MGYTFFDGRLNTNVNMGLSRNQVTREVAGDPEVPDNGGEEPGDSGGGGSVQGGASGTLSGSGGGNVQVRNVSWQINGNARASYRVMDAASLDLSVRTNNNMISQGAGSGFSELETRLGFSYRF